MTADLTGLKRATCSFEIVGTAPYIQSSWGGRNPLFPFESPEAWHGIPTNSIRAALVSACRAAGLQMTQAKLGLFVESDGFDWHDDRPLVKITKGLPRPIEHAIRVQNSVHAQVRHCWNPGWEATVKINYDTCTLTLKDVTNLVARAGLMVGLGEGRPGRRSSGMNWGTFRIVA